MALQRCILRRPQASKPTLGNPWQSVPLVMGLFTVRLGLLTLAILQDERRGRTVNWEAGEGALPT